MSTSGPAPVNPASIQAMQQLAQNQALAAAEAAEDFSTFCDQAAFSPSVMAKRFRPIEEQKQAEMERAGAKDDIDELMILPVPDPEETAGQFQEKNEELKAQTLLILRSRIEKEEDVDEILKITKEVYSDQWLADEALDFATKTTDSKAVRLAKEKHEQLYEREIKAGRNVATESKTFAKEGLGSPISLRDLYREVTSSPKEQLKLFEDLSGRFPFEKLKMAIQFFLHALGSDLRSRGPSMSHAELKKWMDDIRSLQGILGVFRFFQSRMSLIRRAFAGYELPLPFLITFESLAKNFVKLLNERYPTPEKIKMVGKLIGLSNEIAGQIVVFTQYRDALRHVAPKYYRNPQHKEDLHRSLIELLEDLEDEMEEEEEEEEEES